MTALQREVIRAMLETNGNTCDGYGNAECEDFALCIPCSAKVIEYAKRKGGGE